MKELIGVSKTLIVIKDGETIGDFYYEDTQYKITLDKPFKVKPIDNSKGYKSFAPDWLYDWVNEGLDECLKKSKEVYFNS